MRRVGLSGPNGRKGPNFDWAKVPSASSTGGRMYIKPKVERFGTFRELTRTGTNGGGDGCIVLDPVTGDVVDGNPSDGEYGTFPVPGGGTVTLPYCSNEF